MNSLSAYLFDLNEQSGALELFLGGGAFLLLSAALFYLIYLGALKMMTPFSPRDFQIELSYLWALGIMQILLAVFVFLLFRYGKLPKFAFEKPFTFLCFLPHLAVYLICIYQFSISFLRLKEETQNT